MNSGLGCPKWTDLMDKLIGVAAGSLGGYFWSLMSTGLSNSFSRGLPKLKYFTSHM